MSTPEDFGEAIDEALGEDTFGEETSESSR